MDSENTTSNTSSPPDEIEIDPDELEEIPDAKEPTKSSWTWCKLFFNIFGSFIGLFIVLLIYLTGGAFLFYKRESEIELKEHKEMLQNHEALNQSANYLAEYFTRIHYGDPKDSYNNCTIFKYDQICYKDVRIDGYYSACDSKICFNSPFCNCIQQFKKRFENDVRKYAELAICLYSKFRIESKFCK